MDRKKVVKMHEMNKMEDVAKLLGLKLGQFFIIDNVQYKTSIWEE